MKAFKRLLKHLSQSPACSLLYTTSHDPEQQQLQLIDDARLGRSSVAALPNARADNHFPSNNEGVGVFDEVSSNNMEFAADKDVSSDDKEVPETKRFPVMRRLMMMKMFPTAMIRLK